MSARREAGFTLIELLIVVVIIGILAAIAIPQYSKTKAEAADATAKSDLRNLMTAEEQYFYSNQTYSGQLSDLRALGFRTSTGVSMSLTAAGATFHADASHNISPNCLRVAYGSGLDGEIESIPNASSGGGDCGG